MQIHELNNFTGTPGSTDYLAIDSGDETTKIPYGELVPEEPFRNYYGTSSTEAATSTKIVDCTGFVLKTGALLSVKFTYANTATGTCYLNVNETGAKRIRRSGNSTQAVNHIWDANDIVTFVYDGSSWVLTGTEADIASSVISLFEDLGWTQE